MSHGKITASGVPEVIIGNDEIKKSYLGMLCLRLETYVLTENYLLCQEYLKQQRLKRKTKR